MILNCLPAAEGRNALYNFNQYYIHSEIGFLTSALSEGVLGE